ncbi:MAG: hypothetical protein FJY95_16400 [Candidatus Handelsmanbacteria bacterium]|nr:hypothetical protein [Candidatus Handelsmanbacteria bacterium]
MFSLKSLSREALPKALERAERYRLLNEPAVAESICHDILAIEPEHQQALITLILAQTDQFAENAALGAPQVLALIPQLQGEYERCYYAGIICERQARARLKREYPGAWFDAYDLFLQALEWFARAEALRPPGNDEAILRWNTCARLIEGHKLKPRPQDEAEHGIE